MPWPIPAPGDISSRAAAVFEGAFPPNPETGDPGIDARNPNTVATTYCRIVEQAMLDLYYYQGNCAKETMPDTAVENLPRFGQTWNVPRVPAEAASGNIILTGTSVPPTVIPDEQQFTFSGSPIVYQSVAAVTIGSAGTVSVPVVAMTAGAAGNLAAGSTVTLASAVGGLTSQTGIVDGDGISGGLDIQSPESWRAAIIAEIQFEPAGGDAADYVKWAKEALPDVALAACPAAASGGGVVSVVFALTGPAVPSSGQIAEVQAYINTLRPVTANVTVYGATLNPVNVSLHLNPDTPAIRAAAAAALALSFVQDAAIGGTTEFSRLDNAVSSSDGEYSHDMLVNGAQADVAAPSLFAVNVLGTVSFT